MSSSTQLVECVPNISEGIDTAKLARIVERISHSGAKLLHVDSGADANRTVLTLAGSTQQVLEGVRELFRVCAEELDMTKQQGAHPRVGAIDVCPFVPLRGVSVDVLNQAVCTLAEEMSEAYDLPIYLYEWSAKIKERKALSTIRRGGLEALRTRIQSSEWVPDFGPSIVNDRLGATVMGVRQVLLAFNVNLRDASLEQAQTIARRIRRASPSVRAIGWDMPSYNCRQISLNLMEFWEFGLYEAFEVCRREAKIEGVELAGSELVGLVPRQALIDAGQKCRANTSLDAEEALQSAIEYLGLASVRPFTVDAQVLEATLGLTETLNFPTYA